VPGAAIPVLLLTLVQNLMINGQDASEFPATAVPPPAGAHFVRLPPSLPQPNFIVPRFGFFALLPAAIACALSTLMDKR